MFVYIFVRLQCKMKEIIMLRNSYYDKVEADKMNTNSAQFDSLFNKISQKILNGVRSETLSNYTSASNEQQHTSEQCCHDNKARR